MKSSSPALIVLRGNSGSGKSSVAKLLRERATQPVAIVEQDYVRRLILKEKLSDLEAGKSTDSPALVATIAQFSLQAGYHTIVEGMLSFRQHEPILTALANEHPNHYFYYFDVSFPETLKRHATKSNRNEFGEADMRSWYQAQDLTNYSGEVIIPESSSLDATVDRIGHETGLF